MATISKATAHYRAKVAAFSRDRLPDDPDLVDARQNLAALKIEDHVRRVISEAPPLTDEQRERIAALLRAGGAA
jgi:hypothetical protein